MKRIGIADIHRPGSTLRLGLILTVLSGGVALAQDKEDFSGGAGTSTPSGDSATDSRRDLESGSASRPSSDVRDHAKMFAEKTTERAKSELAEIEREFHVPTVVETIESLEGESLDTLTLRRAARSGSQGIFILLVRRETKIEVRVSRRFQKVVNEAQRKTIQQTFIEAFRERHFDQGLLAGVDRIRKILSEERSKGVALETAGSEKGRPGLTGETSLVLRNQVRLNLAGGRILVAGAERKAAEMKLNVNIAVVDDGGHMLTFARMDGARPASGYTALTKAITAATFRQATGPLPPGTTTPDPLLNLSLQNAAAAGGGKITTLFGGIPVIVDGQVIGGVGVGGGSGEQDATIARAAIAAFLEELEREGTPRDKPRESDRKAEPDDLEIK